MFDKGLFSVCALYDARKNKYKIKHFDKCVKNLMAGYSHSNNGQKATQEKITGYIKASGGIKEFDW